MTKTPKNISNLHAFINKEFSCCCVVKYPNMAGPEKCVVKFVDSKIIFFATDEDEVDFKELILGHKNSNYSQDVIAKTVLEFDSAILADVWEMTNSQGYRDGIQLELRASDEIKRIQIIAIASMLEVTILG